MLFFLIAAGALFGVSAGLKLTAVIYAPGAALVSILVAGNLKQRVYHFAYFSGAWWLAFLLLWGPWGLSNYHLTGDPFFPQARNIFHSSWIAPSLLRSPFHSTRHKGNTFLSHFTGRRTTPRMDGKRGTFLRSAICHCLRIRLFGFVDLSTIFYKTRTTYYQPTITISLDGSTVSYFLLFLMLFGYSVFSTLRFAATIESLLGIIIIASLYRLYAYYELRFDRHVATSSVVVILTIIAFTFTNYPDWGRVKYGKSVFLKLAHHNFRTIRLYCTKTQPLHIFPRF